MSKLWKLLTGSDKYEYGAAKSLPSAPIYDLKGHVAHVRALYEAHPNRAPEAKQKLTDECLAAIEHGMGRPIDDALRGFVENNIFELLIYGKAAWTNEYEAPEHRELLQNEQAALTDPNRTEKVQLVIVDLFATLFSNLPTLEGTSLLTVPLHTITKNYVGLVSYIIQQLNEGLFPTLSSFIMENVYRITGTEKGSGKTLKTPADVDDPTEFLRNTPFYDLFTTQVPFAIPQKTWASHGIILAPPNHGKTQLLGSLIADFLHRPDAPGLFVLDPHGDLFTLLSHRVDASRLVTLDPDTSPPPLNFLDFGTSTEAQTLQTFSYLMSSLSGGLSDKQSGVVPYLLKLLRLIPDASLETLRLVVDEKVKRPELSQFAFAIAKLPLVDQGFFHNQFYHSSMDPTKQALGAKLYAAMASDTFREMFGAKTNSVNFDQLIADRKVVLVKGGRESLGDEGMEIFLQFIIAQYYAAGRRREKIPESDRHLCIMIVDEAHTVLKSPVISKILVELRKYGCGFLAATQVLDQIAHEVKASVYGATAIKIAGPVSSASGDAGQLSKDMYCSEQFILSMKAVERSHADWAFYVRGLTDKATRVRVPYGALERLPVAGAASAHGRIVHEPIVPQTHEGPSKPEPHAHKADPPIIPGDDPSKAVPSDWVTKSKQP